MRHNSREAAAASNKLVLPLLLMGLPAAPTSQHALKGQHLIADLHLAVKDLEKCRVCGIAAQKHQLQEGRRKISDQRRGAKKEAASHSNHRFQTKRGT